MKDISRQVANVLSVTAGNTDRCIIKTEVSLVFSNLDVNIQYKLIVCVLDVRYSQF